MLTGIAISPFLIEQVRSLKRVMMSDNDIQENAKTRTLGKTYALILDVFYPPVVEKS